MPSYPQAQIKRIQNRLFQLGFDPGHIDSTWGRRTQAAVRRFQDSKGLIIDGIVGPITYKALFNENMPNANSWRDASLVWFQEARRLKGVSEVPGAVSNLVILNWETDLGIPYGGDDIPWCGLFVAHCIGATLSTEALPISPLAARGWLKFGSECEPALGAVLVFWREDERDLSKGHVGFYAGESANGKSFFVLGGNQSDKVGFAWISKSRLLSARWPASAPAKTTGPIVVTPDSEILPQNEA